MATDTMPLEGMPTHEGDLSIEAHGMDPIPESARYGSVGRVFTVWFTPNLVPAAFFIGTLVTLDFLQARVRHLGPRDHRRQRRRLGLRRAAGDDGPEDRHGPDARWPACRSASRSSLPGLLNWFSTIGWDGINSLFGALAITLIIPADPVLARPGRDRPVPGHAGHLRLRGDPPVREVGRGRARDHVRDPDHRDPRQGRHLARPTGSAASTRSARSSPTSRSSPASCWPGRCTRPTTRATCRPTRPPSKVFWYTLLGMSLASGWLEILGLLVAGQATGGESSDTIFQVLGGSGQHHRARSRWSRSRSGPSPSTR